MSRYDRQQERKRFLIVAAIVVIFAGSLYLWVHRANQEFATMGQISSQSGQD